MKLEDMVMVSVDDHIVEPGDLFKNHLPSEWQARAPRMSKDANGADFWIFDGKRAGAIGLNAVVGRPKEEYGCEPAALEQMRGGAYNIDHRIDDMNVNGILSSINFPSVVGFDGSRFMQFADPAEGLRMLQAYNDWHIDEWCGAHPGRNIPCAIVPFWNPEEAAKEIERTAKKGARTISMCDNPTYHGLPSIHNAVYNPMWKALADNNVVISNHIGSGSPAPHASDESPIEAWIVTMPIAIANSAADWLNLKAIRDYNLKVCLSEGGIGWIPYFLERADFTFQQHGAWTHSSFGGMKPSELFRKHFMTCFIDDEFGLHNVDWIGENNISYECDYPHSDCLWPEAPERLYETIKHLPDSQIDKITHENALRFFDYDAFGKLGGRENCTVGALRAMAANVDVTPQSFGGPAPLAPGVEPRPVTSGDILQMFGDVAKADGELEKA
ncbi:putative TIM-barrel fold metal-dependent hydrolase [Sphingobium sp. OAS761]|uniref:amidohydrolase family protein n=1 Tax=Sphingobium sp. OAS761 TaxID=2817901 RepID=UPI00178AEA17|nr:amidohydrolase family protein [Sphingobium sp. OAS761]MCP1471252.1 putative TIM-barrel fold metal-dependent hydrolase [Sphingobium sp. OAS761]